MITADGWISWAIRDPGPDWKHYAIDNERRGAIAHSMEGIYINARSRLFGPDRASWTGSILYAGTLIEHYPVTYSVWASGSAEANIGFPAFETEGDAGEPFNDAQLATWARIIQDLSAWAGWTPRRPVHPLVYGDPATLIEHRECKVLFDSSPTACPSERADWPRMMGEEEGDMKIAPWWTDRKLPIGDGAINLNIDFGPAKAYEICIVMAPDSRGQMTFLHGDFKMAAVVSSRAANFILVPGQFGTAPFKVIGADGVKIAYLACAGMVK